MTKKTALGWAIIAVMGIAARLERGEAIDRVILADVDFERLTAAQSPANSTSMPATFPAARPGPTPQLNSAARA